MLKPREQCLRREDVDARGRELDGQGQAIEVGADLGDGVCVPIGDGEFEVGGLRTLDKEPDPLYRVN